MEGLARVLMVGWWTIRKHHCLNYGKVGMDFVDDGGQGGVFMDPWKMDEMGLIRQSGRGSDSFRSSFGTLCGFSSHVFMLHGATDSSCADMYALNKVLQHYFGCLLILRVSILLVALHGLFRR